LFQQFIGGYMQSKYFERRKTTLDRRFYDRR